MPPSRLRNAQPQSNYEWLALFLPKVHFWRAHVSRRLAFADQLFVAEFAKSLPFRVLVKIFESYGHGTNLNKRCTKYYKRAGRGGTDGTDLGEACESSSGDARSRESSKASSAAQPRHKDSRRGQCIIRIPCCDAVCRASRATPSRPDSLAEA
jgi:hypothetical protein